MAAAASDQGTLPLGELFATTSNQRRTGARRRERKPKASAKEARMDTLLRNYS
jgi:hypothetical protein